MDRKKFILTSASIAGLAGVPFAGKLDLLNQQLTDEQKGQLRPVSKLFYDRATRFENECYYPVISDIHGSSHMAYLRVNDKEESLVIRDSSNRNAEKVLSSDTYIFDPEFCGGDLFWVQKERKQWKIKYHDIDDDGISSASPFSHWGRPLSINGFNQDEKKYLVWEERNGKQTKIFLGIIKGSSVQETRTISPEEYNAYDPVCTNGNDGFLYVSYCAFYEGNYHIFIQKRTPEGEAVNPPVRITHGAEASLHPSISAHPESGVWISYTKYRLPFEFREWDIPLVEHPRRILQHEFFQSHGLVHAGYFNGEKLLAPYAPPNPGQITGGIAAMMVFGSEQAGRSQIFTDNNGRVRILFRQFSNQKPISFHKEEFLNKTERLELPGPSHVHSSLNLTTLMDEKWAEPVTLVDRAHLETKISFNQNGNQLKVAFAHDGRQVGWGQGGEWFDSEHEVGLGALDIDLAGFGEPNYEFRPFVLKPIAEVSMEEPQFEHEEHGVIYAKGQTHKHTTHSICTREFDMDHHMNYRFLQDVMHCDFGAMTDHSYNFWYTEILYLNKIADYYYFPGQFVAIPAYEWTSSQGHINPLYLEEEGILDVFTPGDDRIEEGMFQSMRKHYAGKKILAPPHHTADAMLSYNWEYYNQELMPMAEIFQDNRGSCEQPEVPGITNYYHTTKKRWIVDQLNKGKKLGLMASGDHVGVAQAFTIVEKLTRSELYEAFKRRRCFGSTGTSVNLDFTCNGSPMGSELHTIEADFGLRVKAPEKVVEIHILRDGENYKLLQVGKKEIQKRWSIQRQRQGEYWFYRVVLTNGEMAWCSPIWLV